MTAAEKKEHKELLEKLETLEQSNGELKQQLAAANAQLEATYSKLDQLAQEKAEAEKESLEIIQDLQEKADQKEIKKAVGHQARISVAGETDRIFEFTTGSFTYESVKYKANDIKDNDPLLVELVKIGAGIIQEVK